MATITATLDSIIVEDGTILVDLDSLIVYNPTTYTISSSGGTYNYTIFIADSGEDAVAVLGENNTFYNCIFISASGTGFVNCSSTTIAKNCIFKGGTADASSTEDISANTSYNCFVSGSTPTNFGSTGNVLEDPVWVDEEGEDFHLDTGSPCIRVGTDVSLDYDFYLRRVNPDYPSIGVAEWVVTETVTSDLDSYVKKLNNIETSNLDSYIKELNSILNTSLDSRLVVEHLFTSSLDSYIKKLADIETLDLDSYIKAEGQLIYLSSDSYIKQLDYSISTSLDAVLSEKPTQIEYRYSRNRLFAGLTRISRSRTFRAKSRQ